MKKRIVNENEKAFLDFLSRPIKQQEFNFNPKDNGIDGYEFHDEILKDYKVVEGDHENF